MDLLNTNVKKMQHLIEGILKDTIIGRQHATPLPVDLNLLIPDIIRMLAPPAHIKIVVHPALPIVYGQEAGFRHIFQNLLSNAIKFMDKPIGIIKITAKATGNSWQFTVADNGPGIDPAHHGPIFQPFKTLQETGPHLENTGLGLPLVRKIVTQYGGIIGVDAALGKGSTFWFTIPKN